MRAGRPPVTASFVPSGEKRTESIRSAHADEPGDETAAIGFVQKHFVEAGDGQQLAVGRPIERRDDGRAAVNGRMVGIDRRRGIGRRIVFRAFFDPAADEGDLARGERRLAFRHRGFALVGRDLLEEIAVVRLAGDDGRRAAFASGEQAFEGGHIQLAAGFGWLMAALAVGLQDREDIGVVADRFRLFPRLGRERQACRPPVILGEFQMTAARIAADRQPRTRFETARRLIQRAPIQGLKEVGRGDVADILGGPAYQLRL